ncbi:hypothetical protein H8B13_10650 [Hymenobacter sp. BT188]|uniref:hypothetical protein n=1 Tax=Hymenobacter sp. BT188 TaxID=2763504 RepID=UPI00165178BE|nr:hypothetical protein [Hymenobacter sp. BT188]MBC6607278.1 hypothetical protein [Hymenobacter sp. BT188]
MVTAVFPLSTARFKLPEPYVQLTSSSGSGCLKIPEGRLGVISIDKQKRLYFSFDEPYQSEIIKRVAARRKVRFTTDQLVELDKMPFLSMDIRYLPEYLSLPVYQRNNIDLSGIPSRLDNHIDDQLAEYIAAAHSVLHYKNGLYPFFSIWADANLESHEVQRVICLLQQHNVNRINFATIMEMKDSALFF